MGKKGKKELSVSAEVTSRTDGFVVVPKKNKKSKHICATEASQAEDGTVLLQPVNERVNIDVKKPIDTDSVALDVKAVRSKKKRKERENVLFDSQKNAEHDTLKYTGEHKTETSYPGLDVNTETAEDQSNRKKGLEDKPNRKAESLNPEGTHNVENGETVRCTTAVVSDRMSAVVQGKRAKKSKTKATTDEEVNVAKSNDDDGALAGKVDSSDVAFQRLEIAEGKPNKHKTEKRKRKCDEVLKSDCHVHEAANATQRVSVKVSETKSAKHNKRQKQTLTDAVDDLSPSAEAKSSQFFEKEEGKVSAVEKRKRKKTGRLQKVADLNCAFLLVSGEQDVVEKKKKTGRPKKETVPENLTDGNVESKQESVNEETNDYASNSQLAPKVNKKMKCRKDDELQTSENANFAALLTGSVATKKLKKSKDCKEKVNPVVQPHTEDESTQKAEAGSVFSEPLESSKTVKTKKSQDHKERKTTDSRNQELASENNATVSQTVDRHTGNGVPDGYVQMECQTKKQSKKAKAESVDEICPVMVYDKSSKGMKRAKVKAAELLILEPQIINQYSEANRPEKRKKVDENEGVEGTKQKDDLGKSYGKNTLTAQNSAKVNKKSSKQKRSFISIAVNSYDDNQICVSEHGDIRNADSDTAVLSPSNLPPSDLTRTLYKSKKHKKADKMTEAGGTKETVQFSDSESTANNRKRMHKADKCELRENLRDSTSSSCTVEQNRTPSVKSDNAAALVESSSGTKKSRKHADTTESTECRPSDAFDENAVSSTAELPEPKSTAGCDLGQWTSAEFDLSERLPKFVRLMGGMKNKVVLGKAQPRQDSASRTSALSRAEEEKLNKSLEHQFYQAQKFAFGKQKRGGLGYEPPPDAGKKFYIDKGAVRSKTFDD